MGKLTTKPTPVPDRLLSNAERQAIARRDHPEVFFTVTPEEYAERMILAKAAVGALTNKQADAVRESVREGRDVPGWR